ncbi:hypothetical protein [Oceanirhabdus seepicola]|uniref:Multidrug-efflux transporter n=1 Tax=Oceanirhabdus seepicola TaxID=2828781 RepID=A0A9J6NWP3_9CLOT|nr:hypothetical protein [Oceanirhabdus seepicola]MCM1988683.1 hypothetical protein [Oceanirhabdus seepicola]
MIKEPISKLILTLAIPAILGQVLDIAYNLIDVIFMYVFPLGMFGAGIATLLAQFLAALYILIYYRKNNKFTLSLKKIEFKYAKEIFSVGSGVFFREIVEAIVLIILNSIILLVGGSIYLSAFSIINKIIM